MLQKQSHKSHFVSQKCCILSLLILCFLFMILSGCGEADSTEKVGHRESTPISENSAANGDANQYWISAYYFAEGWAKNIWDCDMTNIDQQFVQIVNDGFNSVVLVVPWREFQPSTSPISYQEKVFDRLDWVMEKAEQHGLGVLLRVGYYWDQYQNESTDELAQRRIALMYDASMQQAWMEYIKKIYTLASKHDNYWGGFLCWEDFWTFVNNTKSGYNESENKELTKKIGYQDYIRENYSLGDYNQEFRTAYEDVDDILLPTADSPELKVFYDFYDHFLNQLLCNSQQVYPNLSMEVRTDSDPVVNAQGEQEWYSHEKTYSCGNSDYLSTMYGVFQGAENKGETMTAKETLQKTNWIIDTINGITGDKRMYINQFLFYDDTKGFSNNARVQDDQLDDYLTACVKILSQETGGYGIWTYQDYYFTSVYNPCFYEGTSGWEIEGSSSVQETDTGNHFLNLSAGSILRQHEVAGYQDFQPGEKITLQFEITSNTPATVTAQVGTESESLAVSGNGTYQLEFTASDSGCDLSIGTDQDIDIDNIYLFNAVQCGKVYDAFGNEEECCDALRQMNKSISKKLAYKGFSLVSQFDQAEKAGVANADNPWNTNLTCITVPETGATAVYMMPGTELTYTIHVTEDQSSISFSGSLYSQAVAWKVSDGAVVAIQLTNETGEELLSQNLNIAADGTATFFTYDLSPYIGSTVQLHLSCNGGPSENCDGDWVILQNAA